MTVLELIEKLKEFPPDAPVLISEIEDFSIAQMQWRNNGVTFY